jgi:hypothetical protein
MAAMAGIIPADDFEIARNTSIQQVWQSGNCSLRASIPFSSAEQGLRAYLPMLRETTKDADANSRKNPLEPK